MYTQLLFGLLPVALAARQAPPLLFSRDTVPCSETGELDCGEGCIPKGWTCCPDQAGGCGPTESCWLGDNGAYGCCPVGEDCSGDGGANTDTRTLTNTNTNTLTNTLTNTHSSEATTTPPVYTPTSTEDEYTTSTVYTTTVKTITSCAPTVTNCPAHSTVVVTETIPAYTTVCPVSTHKPYPTYTKPEGYVTSTYYITNIYTVTSCAPTVTQCPYGHLTSEIYTTTTVCPAGEIPTYTTVYTPPKYTTSYAPAGNGSCHSCAATATTSKSPIVTAGAANIGAQAVQVLGAAVAAALML